MFVQEQQLCMEGEERSVSVTPNLVWNAAKHHLVNRKMAYWLVKRNRTLPMPENDLEFKEVLREVSGGKYGGCCLPTIKNQIVQMTAVVTLHLKKPIAQMLEEKLLPCMVADLWSESPKKP